MQRLLAAALGFILTLAASDALAATIVVDSTADDNGAGCTLREAVASAQIDNAAGNGCADGDGSDVIVMPAGTYTLTQGFIAMDTPMTIAGAGMGLTIMDGNNNDRHFQVLGSALTISNVRLQNGNGGSGQGGAVRILGGATANLFRVHLTGNTSFFGGAVRVSSNATATVTECEIDNNTADNTAGGGNGGGLQNLGTATIVRSYFHDNDAMNAGGGIHTQPQGADALTIVRDSLFVGNTAGGLGGGIATVFSTDIGRTIVENSTLSGNMANNGGGVGVGGSSHFTDLSHVTITGNTATNNGGGILVGGAAEMGVTNSLIADNTATNLGADCRVDGALSIEHHNLIGDDTDCANGDGFIDATDVLNGTAGLVALADNGGATLTHALDDTSEARGAGDCVSVESALVRFDQRGVQRTVEAACTIGAWDPHAVVGLTSDEPAGANCADGGTKIETGTDLNDNAMLDPDEVTLTQYVCDDASGDQLVEVTPEAAGTNCELGGVRIDTGIDADGNGTLEAGEVTSTEYICNGEAGDAGETGETGEAGGDGPAGDTGAQGPAGPEGGCALSGKPTDASPWLLALLVLGARRRERVAPR